MKKNIAEERKIIMDNNNVGRADGSLKISEDVIAQIAAVAAKEVDGVASIVKPKADIRRAIKNRRFEEPITVTLTDDLAVIDIFIEITFGSKVMKVSGEIQSRVKKMVQNMTEVVVSKVNVHVMSIAPENI